MDIQLQRADMNSLFLLVETELSELFALLSDRQVACLLVDFHQLARGVDCLFPGSLRGEPTYFFRVIALLAEERLNRIAKVLMDPEESWTNVGVGAAHFQFISMAIRLVEEKKIQSVAENSAMRRIELSSLEPRALLAPLSLLSTGSDRDLQTFYRRFLGDFLWVDLGRGLQFESPELVAKLSRNMTSGAARIFLEELVYAKSAPIGAIIKSKLDAMSALRSLVDEGSIGRNAESST